MASYREILAGLSPTHWWKLDETEGTNADDAVGTLDGTYVNTPTLGATGLIAEGTAVTLARASSEHVSIPDHADLKGLTSLSIVAVIKPAVDLDAANPPGIMAHDIGQASSQAGCWTFFLSDGLFALGGGNGSGYAEVKIPAVSPGWTANTRYLIAMVWTGTVARAYRDGSQLGSDTAFTNISGSTATPLGKIGNWSAVDGDAGFFDGTIDEVAYWKNVALTTQNIADLYAAMDNAPTSSQMLRPDADTVVTGWTPSAGGNVYSVVSDEADGTYASATLA